MNYISREKLIDLILLDEDIWHGSDGKIYANVSEPAEEVLKALGTKESPWVKASRPKGKVDAYIPIISAADATASGISVGDQQTAQYIISSQLFAEFDILPSRIYLSGKNAFYNDSNKNEMQEILKMAQELFGPAAGSKYIGKGKPRFSPDTTIEEIMSVLDDTPDELAKIYKIRIDFVVDTESVESEDTDVIPSDGKKKAKASKALTWKMLMTPDVKPDKPEIRKRFPEGYNSILLRRVEDECNKAGIINQYADVYREIYDFLKDIYLSKKFDKPLDYAKHLRANEQVKNRLERSELSPYWNKVMSSANVSTAGQIADRLGSLITSKTETAKVKGNVNKVLHWKLAKRLPEIKQYLDNFPSFLNYLKNTVKFRYDDILENFGMDEEELKQFNTFAEFAQYVYKQPELTRGIAERAKVNNSGTAKGAVKQGIEMGVIARSLRKQIENARQGKGRKAASVAQKRERMKELRVDIEARKEDIADLKKELKSTTPEEAAEIEAKIKGLTALNAKDIKTIAALNHQIKKTLAANPEAEHEDAGDKQERHTKELEDKLHNIISTRLASIDDQNAAEAFLDRNDKSGEHRKRMAMGSDYGSERIITKFTVTVPAAVLGDNVKLRKQLETHFTKRANAFGKKLNDAETARGKEALTDVYCDALDSRDGGMKVLVEIEYPEKSITAKQIKNSIYDLINDMLKPFPKEAGIKASTPEIGVQ